MSRTLRQLVKWSYLLSAMLLIALAVAVQSGRSFSHLIGNYTPDISSYLSEKLNARVSISQINARWDGLKPSLDLQQLSIHSKAGEPILAFSRARIRLDILGSLVNLRWVWSNVILSDVQVDFTQQLSGKWQINGLPPTSLKPSPEASTKSTGVRLGALVDMLLLSNRIEFQGSHLGFTFTDGRTVELNTPLLLLENAKDFHRLSAQVDVDSQERAVYLMLEGQGDPRDRARFSTQGYLQLNQFPTNEPIAALNAFLLHGVDQHRLQAEGKISANIWFESRPDVDGFDVYGNAKLERLLLPFAQRQLQLDGFSTDITGSWHYGGTWQLGLQAIDAQYQQRVISGLNLELGFVSSEAPLQMKMNHLDLAGLAGLLQDAGVLGNGRIQEVVTALAPRGQLSNLRLALPLAKPADWKLKANVESLAVNAWHGIPALAGVDGYLELGQRDGFINLDSRAGLSMHFTPTYKNPMEFDRVNGQVAWHLSPEKNQVYVNSGPLKFFQGEEKVTGYLWLSMPWQRNTGDIDLYLQLGGREVSASQYQKYVPAVVPESLSHWLDQSVGEQNPGVARTVGVIYRATINNKDPHSHSLDVYLDLVHSHLNYHPEWPALDNLSGRLLISNAVVKAEVSKARIYDSQVEKAQILITPYQQGKGSLLTVKGNIQGGAEDGMRVLREGMLRRYIGSNMDAWFLMGDLKTSVEMSMPLGADTAHANDIYQQVDADVSAPLFELQNLNLEVKNLQGRITYNSKKGLSSQDLTATLFDEPVTADLSTKQLNGYSQTQVKINGAVESDILARWSKRPEVLFLEGKVPYTTLVEINHRPTATPRDEDNSSSDPSIDKTQEEPANPMHLSSEDFGEQAFAKVVFTSNLQGVKVDLPGAFGKSPNRNRPLKFTWWLQENQSQIALNYDEKVQALFRLDRLDNNRLLNAAIGLNVTPAFSPNAEFLVIGTLPDFNLDTWKQVLSRYQNYGENLGIATDPAQEAADPSRIAGLVFRGDIKLGHYDIGSLRLENLAVIATRDNVGWKLDVANPAIEGSITVPESTQVPLQANLKFLHLSQKDLGDESNPNAEAGDAEKKVQDKTTLDPRQLPLANIAVDNLSLDGDRFGSWSLQMRPNAKGVTIENIHGSIRGMTINNATNKLEGAKLIWQHDDQGESTRFIGSISAGDIADVMRQWHKPDTLESQAANFVVDVYWAGTPQDFKLIDIQGDMDLVFEKGRFKRNASPEDGLLRLLSVLNFDSIARRMRLDFSDLYQSGLAYDRITGKVHFNQGIMEFTEPLEVRGPSSRLQMAGQLDLRRERINTRLVATLPVAGNLTFFTALATGLPAAAGIYIVSKLFKKQVDQVTSISYRIRGSWDDPKMRFDRLFESEDSLRDSVKPDVPSSKLRRPEEEDVEATKG